MQHRNADGTRFLNRFISVQDGDRRTGFRHAKSLCNRQSLVGPGLQERKGAWRATDATHLQGVKFCLSKSRLLAHEQIMCRYAEEMREAIVGIL